MEITKQILLSDVAELSESAFESLLKDESLISGLSYGIKHGSFFGPRFSALKKRLSEIQAPVKTQATYEKTEICGICKCTISQDLMMSSTQGTVCPDCYDEASL